MMHAYVSAHGTYICEIGKAFPLTGPHVGSRATGQFEIVAAAAVMVSGCSCGVPFSFHPPNYLD